MMEQALRAAALSAVLGLAIAAAAPTARAHRLEVEAGFVGGTIEGEVFFDDGAPARRCRVRLHETATTTADQTLAHVDADDEGRFQLPVPAAAWRRAFERGAPLRIVAVDGAGHRAEAALLPPSAAPPEDAPPDLDEARERIQRRLRDLQAKRRRDRLRLLVGLGSAILAGTWLWTRSRRANGPPPAPAP